jgi:class 3 adenylate cyclase
MAKPKFKSREEYEKWKAGRTSQDTGCSNGDNNLCAKYKIIKHLTKSLFYFCTAIMPIALLPVLVRYKPEFATYPLAGVALGIEEAISTLIKSFIPTEFFQIDWTTVIVIAVAFISSHWFDNISKRYGAMITQLEIRSKVEDLKKTMHISNDAEVLDPIKKKLESFKSGNKHDREDLLRIFAETKKKLDTMGKDLAFLSIDVVDSTGMKQGEEKALIEYTFKEYKKLVEGKMKNNGALKSAWTPDGVMICFNSVDAAVRTAREVISALPEFNSNVKSIKKDIVVRCGINSGYVYCDDSMPMEEMSDRVIDVAGHMQKYAAPNTIFIAKPAIEPTNEISGFAPASRVVDGYEVYSWKGNN